MAERHQPAEGRIGAQIRVGSANPLLRGGTVGYLRIPPGVDPGASGVGALPGYRPIQPPSTVRISPCT